MRSATILLLSIIFCSFTLIQGDWITIKSEKEGYKISFPKKPEEQQQTVPSDVGELKMNMLIYEVGSNIKDDNLVYLFNYTDYPEATLKDADSTMAEIILTGAVNGGTKNVSGKLLSVSDINYKNYPGKEARIDFKNGLAIIVMRCYLVKKRLYLTEVIALTENDKNANEKKFLDSFELFE